MLLVPLPQTVEVLWLNKRRDLGFFRFPRDEKRSKQWVINCRREDLQSKPVAALYRGNVLCEEHFEKSCFKAPKSTRRRQLTKHAVPTLFAMSSPPPKFTLKKQTPESQPYTITAASESGGGGNDDQIDNHGLETADAVASGYGPHNSSTQSSLRKKWKASKESTIWELLKSQKTSPGVQTQHAPKDSSSPLMTDPASEDGTRGLINCSTDDEAVLPEVKLEEPMYDSDTEEESTPHCSLERRLVPYSSEAKLAELLALPNYDNEPRPEYTPELDVECQAIKTEVDDGEEVFNLNGAEENRLASCTADQFDSIGMTIANKLRSLPCEQSIIAEKIFNEVMCEAESGNLTAESTFVLIKPDNDIDETGLS